MSGYPDRCVASRQKVLTVYVVDAGQVYRVIAPARVIAQILGLKWETVKKRRLRGAPWSESFIPPRPLVRQAQGHSIKRHSH